MNLKSLAQHLGISASTVSRVMAGRGDEFRIAKETQKHILDEAAAMGVRPDELARSLRLQSTRTLGLVIPDISNPFFATLARAVERRARAQGYTVLLADSQETAEVEAECIRTLLDRRIDGLILAPVGGDSAHLQPLIASKLPLTQVDRVFTALKTAAVVADNFSAAREAVARLAKLGHRRIACLQGREDSSVIAERVRGYRAGLSEAGLRFEPKLLAGGEHSQVIAREHTLHLLGLRPRPTAVLALSNQLALGALEAVRELGLAIPDDLSLIAFDEQPWAALLSPPLTTLAQPVEDMGTMAVDSLCAQIKRGAKTSRKALMTLPMRLIERASIGRRKKD
ncbi:LacI family DNA-binding transcriptional regulator [Prosthecobacter sp.]|uniref:LacI family DNA-binding transcriptional regulator n=1 Tax=Prosthecobacter sp. TaxID=1965333 RepID=UPI003784CD1B